MYSLPIEVLWISKCKYNNTSVNLHEHEFYHLFYIKKGGCLFTVNAMKTEAQEDDIYFCHPGVTHGLVSEGAHALYTIEVKFVVRDLELDKALKNLDYKTRLTVKNLYLKLDELILEALYKPCYYKEIINTNFAGILFELLRKNKHLQSDLSIIDEKHNMVNNPGLNAALDYMQKNYANNISLQQLANIAVINSAYFGKLFKDVYKVSPIQYLNNLRLTQAKELMMYSDSNITQISEMVGFKSIHYFSRVFKKKENLSPNDFKKKFVDNIYILLEENPPVYS